MHGSGGSWNMYVEGDKWRKISGGEVGRETCDKYNEKRPVGIDI